MNSLTDQQLLKNYTKLRSEAAFAELVRRHVDFVYSAALRMVRNTHLAEDVTQGVFVAAAQSARQLVDCSVLPGWLHRTTLNLAANAVRTDVRRRAREQEAAVMNELLSAHPDASWEHIAPHLDDALGELSEPDRDAVLLRYFKNHDLRTVGATLGISDDAAQKRVSRAVERLREFFAKRGVTVGASGLAVVISANAVQAAPVGLALTISTAAALTGTTLATTATITATKTIAMTALQKITATIAVLAGAGIYEARHASQLRDQIQTLQRQQVAAAEQVQQSNSERDATTNRLAALADEFENRKGNLNELLKLRGEVARLRKENGDIASESKEASDHLSSVMQIFSNTPPIKTLVSTATTTANWNQSVVTGGWKTPSGSRAIVLATPQPRDETQQLTIRTHVLEYTEEAGKILGLDQFNATGNSTGKAYKLSADQMDAIMKAAENNSGVKMTRGAITTRSGMQSEIQMVDAHRTPSGEEYSTGPVLNFIPTITADGQSVDMKINTRLDYLLSPILTGNSVK